MHERELAVDRIGVADGDIQGQVGAHGGHPLGVGQGRAPANTASSPSISRLNPVRASATYASTWASSRDSRLGPSSRTSTHPARLTAAAHRICEGGVVTELADKSDTATDAAAVVNPRETPRDSGTVLAGCLAAGWVLLAGALAIAAVALVAWLTDNRSGAPAASALLVAVQVWLLAHGASLDLPWGDVTLLPLGVTAVPAWLLMRAGVWVARRRQLTTLAGLAEAVASITIVYAVVAVMLTALARTSDVSVSPWRVGIGAALLAAIAGTIGALRETGLARMLVVFVPGPRRAVARCTLAAVCAMTAAGALLVAVALAADIGGYGELSRAVAPGWAGAVGLLVLALLVLPNAISYATAVLIGPGFAVGTGTGVSVFGVQLGAVPALPLLAALPDGDRLPVLAWMVLGVPVAAGVLAGWVLVRRLDDDDDRGWLSTAAWAGAGGALAGVALGLVSVLATGSLGSGQLAEVGPTGWLVGVLGAAELATAAALGAGLFRYLALRAR